MDECAACKPAPLNARGFNKNVTLPYGLTVVDVRKAMAQFLDFLGFLRAVNRGKGARLCPSKDGGIRQIPPLPLARFSNWSASYSLTP